MSDSFTPSPCCFSGSVSDKKAVGTVEVIGGVSTYVSKPQGDTRGRAIVFATDVFGQSYVNARIAADKFARAGHAVYIPDLFNGRPATPEGMELLASLSKKQRDPGLMGWLSYILFCIWHVLQLVVIFVPFMVKHRKPAQKLPIMDAVFADLKQNHGVSKIGVIGFCYGGFFCLHYGKQADGPVQAFAIAHAQIKVPADIAPLVKPGLFICADHDMAFSDAARLQAEALLSQRKDAKYVFRFYPGTFHGFAVRGDDKVPLIQQAQDDAIATAAAFFDEQLA